MSESPLASPDNALVKDLRALHKSEGRHAAGAFLVEGRRAIDGFLAGGRQPDVLLRPVGEPAPAEWPPAREVGPRVAARLSQSTTPSGWFARFAIPDPGPLDAAAGGLVLVGVGDPGNVGTLIRSAAAFGLAQVAMAGGADPWSHKVVQASAGALATVRVHVLDPAGGLTPLRGGARISALVVAGGQDPATVAAARRWLVVGSEAHGLPDAWLGDQVERLTLPMPGPTESLNAAVAGSIACYLLARGLV